MRTHLLGSVALLLVLLLSAFTWLQTSILVPELPATPDNYANIPVPNHLDRPAIQVQINTPDTNPITDAGATLGRVLFYEKALSQNRTVACGSCHLQAFAFTDTATLSVGFEGGLTGRNSMSLTNAKYYPNGRFFWDERAASLEHQVLQPIQDAVEMGLTLDTIVGRIQAEDYYASLFSDAFGTDSIDANRISLALAQFVRSMVTYDSKYDQGRAQSPPGPPLDSFPNFSTAENLGKALFFDPERGNCAACHMTDMFVQPDARNNGLDSALTDLGLFNVTGDPQDRGKFKVPSLRNVGLSAPYMHDGRFATLEEVMEHYDHGVQLHPTLAPQLREPPAGGGPPAPNAPPRQLNFTPEEQAGMIAFLHTLTDTGFANDVRWSDPFVEQITPPLAVEAWEEQPTLQLFPNPATETIHLRWDTSAPQAVEVQVLDLQGRLLHQLSLSAQSESQIELPSLPAGLYLIRVSSREQVIFQEKWLIR